MKVFYKFAMVLALGSGLTMGQDTSPRDKTTRDDGKAGHHDAVHGEKEIAACKLVECRNEIELAKFALTKTQNPQVKEFADKMIKDHGEACKDLEKWAGDYKIEKVEGKVESGASEKENSGTRLELQTKKGGVVGVDFNAGGSHMASGALNWPAIHQEMAAKCLAAAKKELGEKEGVEFDKCYMGMQLGAHQKMIIADEVLSKYVSAESREKLEKCKTTATEHLEMAKNIMKTLEGKTSAEVSRRTK